MLASDRVWLASYHLGGTSRTRYYALEQDVGRPSWERFKDLCKLRFGPAICTNRLAELARLLFYTSVHDYHPICCQPKRPICSWAASRVDVEL